MKQIPFWEKANLTLEEAAAYFSIGQQKLRDLTDNEDCDFVLWIGSKRLIKKNKFLKYIEEQYSI
ncbi:MAG: helix-turn-helix domain-containing protein [Clostridia bacterium]|nr:helix-turn-helix domain-containing protein [Clostridia bacterium]